MLPSCWSQAINRSDADIVHLHWVSAETISIEDIGRIRKTVVWTAHDMWPFCGAEHNPPDLPNARWRQGYTAMNRPAANKGIDIDRWTWNRKRRAWRNPMWMVCPSRWLANCVRESALMRDCNVSTIAHPLNTEVFKRLDRGFCRASLNLPSDRRIVLFGAIAGSSDPNKGYDLLLGALRSLGAECRARRMLCVVFGQTQPREPPELPLSVRWMGHLHDDVTLALLYNSADVMIVPSRQESLGQTGTEAQACGCPVVAFNTSGLRDVVDHGVTGYLAEPYDAKDLANGIMWVLANVDSRANLGYAARERAVRLWSPEIVVTQYLEAYQNALAYGASHVSRSIERSKRSANAAVHPESRTQER
jgi:glycosyltransferase involved in cell wall biosynthesis